MSQKLNGFRATAVWVCISLFLAACNQGLSTEGIQAYFQPVTFLRLPEQATLVGIGEATHGNAEFVQLRQVVLEQLVTRSGFTAFALEGDFGGGQVVNKYVLNGTGTAEEAVKEIGFAIYRTQEMVDLVSWIRQYNLAHPEQPIRFYGFDLQRYDNNIAGLMAYFQQVDPELVEPYRVSLADLNDETVFNQQQEKVLAGLHAIEQIRAELQQNKERYVAASSELAFSLADQFAASIQENATLHSGGGNYSQMRDEYMASKVSWIVEYDRALGGGRVLIAGHNGHIEKSSAALQHQSMGSRLNEEYGEQYFAIGTDFIESAFSSQEASGRERKQFSVKNNNALNRVFEATGLDQAYLDIHSALESPTLQPLLTTKQPMSNIGDSFARWYAFIPQLYTLKMAPAEAYDAIIFVRKATPVTRLEEW